MHKYTHKKVLPGATVLHNNKHKSKHMPGFLCSALGDWVFLYVQCWFKPVLVKKRLQLLIWKGHSCQHMGNTNLDAWSVYSQSASSDLQHMQTVNLYFFCSEAGLCIVCNTEPYMCKWCLRRPSAFPWKDENFMQMVVPCSGSILGVFWSQTLCWALYTVNVCLCTHMCAHNCQLLSRQSSVTSFKLQVE